MNGDDMTDTKMGMFAKKVAEAVHPPTAPDSTGKNIMSRREGILISVFVALLPVIGGGYVLQERVARAADDIDEKADAVVVDVLIKEVDKKADDSLVNARFDNVQNQLNTIEAQGIENKLELKEIKEKTSDTYTAVQVLLERIPPR